MTIKEMITFRSYIDSFLSLLKYQEKLAKSKMEYKRKEAAKVLDFMYPKLKSTTLFYVKLFLDDPNIAKNHVFRASLKKDILEKVKQHVDVKLPKKYIQILKKTIK